MNQLVAPQVVSIAQIEAAINAWRNRSPASSSQDDGEAIVLCDEARSLADVYGGMIFRRQQEIAVSALSAAQVAALAVIGL
jgi:hypothetical protein